MASNPHAVPGMGYIKGNPAAKAGGLEKCACRTKCGEVELKITLTPKFLAKPLREALVEPFLKVYNKRAAAALSWEEVLCVKINGYTIDNDALGTKPCGEILKREDVTVLLLPTLPKTLFEALFEVAREFEELTAENYHNRPPEAMTMQLLRLAQAAVDIGEPDSDIARRATNAFEAISGGAASVSGAQVRSMMLSDAYVRSCCFPQKCAHTRVLNDKLGRMAVARAGEHTVCVAEFTKFFVALSAAACAPEAMAEELPEDRPKSYGESGDAGHFLQQLMDDDSCSVNRIA